MPSEDQLGGSPPPSSAGLCLAVRLPRAASRRDRALIYVQRGVPPITSAEVEIMHEHLEKSAREIRNAAQNDN
jgi:hypothetical protein